MTRTNGDRHRTRTAHPASHQRGGRTLAASIRRNEWERVALLLLLALTDVASAMPAGDIDDVLALLAQEASDDRR